jgi:hypothetical protein
MNAVTLWMFLLPTVLFCAMLAAAVAGHRLASGRRQKPDEATLVGTGAIDAAVLGLLGLLVAFWFSSAGTRLDMRRSLIVEEANAIGTAWLRLDVLPADVRTAEHDLFRRYVDVRLLQSRRPPRADDASLDERLTGLRHEIWGRAIAAVPACASDQTAAILLESLNAMFDAATRHQAAFNAHTPTAILVLLVLVAAFSAALAGHDMGGRASFNWLHAIVFAGVVSVTIWVIYDLEMPRYGLIRVDNYDRTISDLRAEFDRPESAVPPR